MTLQSVDQKEIGRFYKDLLENPEAYAERPVVIWKSYFQDGILFPILHHINLEHYKERKRDDWKILGLKCLHLQSLNTKDLNDSFNPGRHKGCVAYVDIPDDKFQDPEPFDFNPLSLIFDWLKKITKTAKVPVILHLPFIEHPEAFQGMDVNQYIYHPDFEEWKRREINSNNPLVNLLIGFLDSSASILERDYRWYGYFHRSPDRKPESDNQDLQKGTGCDFPSCWMEGVHKLRRFIHLPMAQIPKNYKPRKDIRISEMSTEKFKSFFSDGISDDLIEKFRNYLIEHHDRWEDLYTKLSNG